MEKHHQLHPSSRRGEARGGFFPWFLILLGLPLLGLGIWGLYRGLATLKWPHTTATILDANLRLRESTPNHPTVDSGPVHVRERSETASVAFRYEYAVDGTKYIGDGIEVADFGLQNSALARTQYDKYPVGSTAQVAYDPSDPQTCYLEPGPSSTSKLLVGLGIVFLLIGLMVRRAMRIQASGGIR